MKKKCTGRAGLFATRTRISVMLPRLSISLFGLGLTISCSLIRFLPAVSTEPTEIPAASIAPSNRTPAVEVTPTHQPIELATLTPTPFETPRGNPRTLSEQQAALLPEFSADLDMLEAATRYWIELEVDFDPQAQQASLRGVVRFQFINPLESALDDLVLMFWPNDPQYESSIQAGPLIVAGQEVQGRDEINGRARRYFLPQSLEPGEALDASIVFQVQAGGPIGFGSPRRFGITRGVLFAPTFYPLIPRLIDGQWQVLPPPIGGDTTNSDVAFYEVSINADSRYQLATSGVEVGVDTAGSGRETRRFVSGPMRDFAFALGTFEHGERIVEGVRVRGWVIPDHIEDLDRMLDAAALQMETLSERIGPYPYPELDLVDVPGAYGGIEYPGLVSVGTVGGFNLIVPTVHEVGHQWFYGLIGVDQLLEPWLDEGAASYTEIMYFEAAQGSGRATGILADMRAQLRSHPDPDQPVGLPVGAYASTRDYGLFVYLKGALFFDALRSQLGDEIFFDFLQTYLETYRYQVASSLDFQAQAEAACDCDLDELFDLWVYRGGEVPGL